MNSPAAALYPSLFSAPHAQRNALIAELSKPSHYAGLHYDIMDFHFVDNLTGSIAEITTLSATPQVPLWVHAMVMDPERLFAKLSLKAGDIFTWHIERPVSSNFGATLKVHALKASIAIRPETPLGELLPFLSDIDQILVMGVEPGFSGQKMLPGTLERIAHLTRLRADHGHKFTIGIDGGITNANIDAATAAGADAIVVGSMIFE